MPCISSSGASAHLMSGLSPPLRASRAGILKEQGKKCWLIRPTPPPCSSRRNSLQSITARRQKKSWLIRPAPPPVQPCKLFHKFSIPRCSTAAEHSLCSTHSASQCCHLLTRPCCDCFHNSGPSLSLSLSLSLFSARISHKLKATNISPISLLLLMSILTGQCLSCYVFPHFLSAPLSQNMKPNRQPMCYSLAGLYVTDFVWLTLCRPVTKEDYHTQSRTYTMRL